SLEGQLVGDEFMVPKAPKGTVLIVARDGRMEAFAAKSFNAEWAGPTLAILGGAMDLKDFKLKTVPKETASQLMRQVFGHEVVPLGVREAAMRELIARAKPDWEVDFMTLPPALQLPSLGAPFVEYFTRFPRAQFSSAARWDVFRELRSKDAVPYLTKEFEEIRATEDSNVLRYALEALAVSDADAARCAFSDVLAQGGLWLGRETSNREVEVELAGRIAKFPAGAPCRAFPFRRDLPFPSDATSLRRVAFFSDDPALPPKLIEWSRKQKDESLAESALWAAGRVAERAPQSDSLEPIAALLAAEFKTRRAPVMHGASGALTRLINRRPALFEWLLAHPTPSASPYGKPDDLFEAVLAQLDWSDEAFAKNVFAKVVAQKKVPGGIATLHKEKPEFVRSELAKLLTSTEVAALTYALQLGGRAGIDAIPLADVARLMAHANAGVRFEAVQALSIHLVGSEQYSRGVPHFPVLLDRLEDDDEKVRAYALLLVSQLATKGKYPQYANATPELKSLVATVRERAAKAKGPAKERLDSALRSLN
ncbi:MAG: hypothetical protein JNM17_29115, partial [Archangium sp.]|nr:hypothetical protein [Archangium sp.]